MVAAVVWLLASGAFGFYVSQFGSYNKTWGSLSAVVIMLTWLWLGALALLVARRSTPRLSAAGSCAAWPSRGRAPGADEEIVPRPVMPSSFWVASTKPEAALSAAKAGSLGKGEVDTGAA